jgi:hypothetical protein
MMRFNLTALSLLLACGQAWSQDTPPAIAQATTPIATEVQSNVELTIERIVVEDTGARIEELRVGGETKSIDVQPKNGMPAYQVAPKTGERTWKVLGF